MVAFSAIRLENRRTHEGWFFKWHDFYDALPGPGSDYLLKKPWERMKDREQAEFNFCFLPTHWEQFVNTIRNSDYCKHNVRDIKRSRESYEQLMYRMAHSRPVRFMITPGKDRVVVGSRQAIFKMEARV